MANSLGTAELVNILSKSFLFNLQAALKPLDRFTVDYSAEAIAKRGASITTQITQAQTAAQSRSDFTADYNIDNSGLTDIVITLSQEYYKQIQLTANEMSVSPVNLEDRIIRPAAYSMARAIEANILSNITAVNFANNYAVTPSSMAYSDVTALAKAGTKLFWPSYGRCLFLNPDAIAALKNDTTVTKLFSQSAEVAVLDGYIGKLGGFEVFESATLPVSGDYVGFAALPQALVAAVRPPMGYDESIIPGEVKYEEADSGLTIRRTKFWNLLNDTWNLRWSTMMGSNAGDKTALIRLTLS